MPGLKIQDKDIDLPTLLREAVEPIRSDLARVTEKVDGLGREISELTGTQKMTYKQVMRNADVASELSQRVAKVEAKTKRHATTTITGAIAEAIQRPSTIVLLTIAVMFAIAYGALDLTEIIGGWHK